RCNGLWRLGFWRFLPAGSRRSTARLRPCTAEPAEDRADRNGRALLGDNFGKHASFGRGDFNGDLVRFQLDERFVFLHSVAGLFHPLGDGGFADAFAEGRHYDVGHLTSLAWWRI